MTVAMLLTSINAHMVSDMSNEKPLQRVKVTAALLDRLPSLLITF